MAKPTTALRFERLDCAGLRVFAAWFDEGELRRRLSAPDEAWFRYVSAGAGNGAWLAYEGERAVGQVQLDAAPDGTGSLSLAVHPALRGRGYGGRILAAFLRGEEALRLGEITACIEADNAASLRCFRACGFVPRGDGPDADGLIEHVLTREAGLP